MAHHISRIQWGGSEPLKSNLWKLSFLNTSNLAIHNIWKSFLDESDDDSDTISFYVRSAKIPGLSIGSHESKFMGLKIQLPAPEDTSDKKLDITFDEFESQKIYTLFNSWISNTFSQNSGYTHSEETSLLDAHMVDLKLELYGLDGQKLENYIVFHKAFPTSISQAELTYESCNKLVFTVSFSYQYYSLMKGDKPVFVDTRWSEEDQAEYDEMIVTMSDDLAGKGLKAAKGNGAQ